jgi:integrase
MAKTKVVQMPVPKRRKGRTKLTDAAVRDLPLQQPEEKHPAIYYDTDLRGFYVLCHRTSKSYYVSRDISGKSVTVCLGRTNELTAKDARDKARAEIQKMRDGRNPNDERRKKALEALAQAETEGFTLADAVRLHLYERKKERSEKTIREYEKVFNTHLKPFMDKSLVWLGEHQEVVEQLHDYITKNGWDTEARKGRGRKKRRPAPYAANGMVRAFRAAYNCARLKKPHLKLPEFRPVEMNPEEARDSSMTLEQLPMWWAEVHKMHPIHRDWNLFALLSGARRESISEMRWEHVDLEGKETGVPSVFLPRPKGGRAKAYYIPLSERLVELLRGRKACAVTNSDFPGSEWVFPSGGSQSGHIEDPDEAVIEDKREEDGKRNVSPHALRHTYTTFGHFAGVNKTDLDFLTNHRPKSITVAYMRVLLGPLRERQEVISKYILDVAKNELPSGK